MPDWNEPDLRRAAYLHEAGHGVVAIDHGLVVDKVACHGQIGFCHADLSADANAQLDQLLIDGQSGKIASRPLLVQAIDLYFGRLATLLGGVAGESLILGRPIYSTRRASDDLTSFFGFLALLSRRLSAPEFDPLWSDAFQRAQDAAWGTVRRRYADVEKLADALKENSTLSGDQVTEILGN
jgi:hypothetical protein